MTDAHSAAAIVKTGAEGAAAWLPLLQTLAGGVLAGGVALYVNHRSHKNALEREEKSAAERLRNERQAAEEKFARERFFIATELIFLLEQFAEGCARVASDTGEYNHADQPEIEPAVNYPLLDLTDVSGDWRVLPRLLMYRIRELPVLQNEAQRTIVSVGEHYDPPYHSDFFRERHYQFARLGVKSVILAMRLRRFVGLPETRLRATQWSAYNVLWKKWRGESNRRIVLKRLQKQALAPFEIMNSQRKAVQGAELTESNKS